MPIVISPEETDGDKAGAITAARALTLVADAAPTPPPPPDPPPPGFFSFG
jgi:hypothetical protein